MENKCIGLCIAYTGTNYGQLLQAYATQQVIRNRGFRTEILRYVSGRNKGIRPSYGAAVVAIKQTVGKVMSKLRQSDTEEDKLHQKNRMLRKRNAERFRENRLCDEVQCYGIDELRDRSKRYFAVLVGSDQVWLPDVAVSNFYTLRFAVSGVRRISYATSLGVSVYPNYAKKPAADFWKEIDFLSVREQQGKDIIQSIVDVPVEVVADPTYLLSKLEWAELIPYKRIMKDGYILCYFLGDSDSIKSYARKFADEQRLPIVSILSDECNSDDSKYADEVLVGKTVEDFVNLIRNADYVLTDSFHGLAFSVIHQKQFLVFYRKRIDARESRNSRIDNIVRLLGIEGRLISNPEIQRFPMTDINYQEVEKKIQKLRDKSFAFLDKALSE